MGGREEVLMPGVPRDSRKDPDISYEKRNKLLLFISLDCPFFWCISLLTDFS